MQEPQETRVQSLGQEDPLEEEMATHSTILVWKIPWTEEPGKLQSMGLQRVGNAWATEPRHTLTFFHLLAFSLSRHLCVFFNWSIVDLLICFILISSVNIVIWIFIDHAPFIVIIKYWLHSLCCTIYPCSLFILYRLVSGSESSTPIVPAPPPHPHHFPLLTGHH